MQKTVLIALGLAATALAGTTLALTQGAEKPAPLLNWQDAQVVARGETVYQDQCTSCHGPIGVTSDTATAPPHDENGHTWKHADFALVQLTKTGEVAELCRDMENTDMPEFGQELTDRQIVDVLSYIKSTWPEDLRKRQDEMNQLYQAQNTAVRELLDLPDN